MKVECPYCNKTFDWTPSEKEVAVRSSRHVVTCENPKCNKSFDVVD